VVFFGDNYLFATLSDVLEGQLFAMVGASLDDNGQTKSVGCPGAKVKVLFFD